jgi:hypothetical protein
MEPITTTITAVVSQIKLWSGLLGKWKTERQEKLAKMALSDVELIDSYVQQGRLKELYDCYKDTSGWPQTEARQYLNLVIEEIMSIEPQALLGAEAMSWETFQQKLGYGLRGAIEIPSASTGEVKEVEKQQSITKTAESISSSPLNLIQKYWYIIPIILIPLVIWYCKKKGNPCKLR